MFNHLYNCCILTLIYCTVQFFSDNFQFKTLMKSRSEFIAVINEINKIKRPERFYLTAPAPAVKTGFYRLCSTRGSKRTGTVQDFLPILE
jgi:hypothetical protein